MADAAPRMDGCVYGDSKPGSLFIVVDGFGLCLFHWKAEGRPWGSRKADMAAAQRALEAARDAMTKRGGADRQAVRAGRT